jgi:hypothetical protein
MSENASESTAPTEQQEPQAGAEQPQDQPKTFDAEYVAKLRKEAAQYRTEAKANADAAKRLQEIEDANKSELQKATDRLTAIERERDQARIDGLRFKVAVKHGISEEDAELFLTGTDEDSLTRQAARLAEREAARVAARDAEDDERKKRGNHVPREGAATNVSESDERAAVRGLFGS